MSSTSNQSKGKRIALEEVSPGPSAGGSLEPIDEEPASEQGPTSEQGLPSERTPERPESSSSKGHPKGTPEHRHDDLQGLGRWSKTFEGQKVDDGDMHVYTPEMESPSVQHRFRQTAGQLDEASKRLERRGPLSAYLENIPETGPGEGSSSVAAGKKRAAQSSTSSKDSEEKPKKALPKRQAKAPRKK